LRLLFVIDSLGFGGAERQLVELVKGLDPCKYDVHVVCFDDSIEGFSEILESCGIDICYIKRAFKYDIRIVFSLAKYIRRNDIHVVHAFLNLGALVGVLAARFAGRPVVCSGIRDAKDKNLKLKLSKRALAILSDILVANSRAGFANRFSRMRPHFRVVYNGVDFSRFEKQIDTSDLKADLHLSNFKHIIGMVASLSERKDHYTLLKAAPIVLQNLPNTCFLLVGDGTRRRVLRKKVEELGLENNILFLGFRSDVDHILNILDVFILLTNPDVHLEGISNSIIEAMAVGVPVIASEGGGTGEIIQHNVNGILLKPKHPQEAAQAILRLLSNKAEAAVLASAAETYVTRTFGLQRYVDAYEKIYRELLSNNQFE